MNNNDNSIYSSLFSNKNNSNENIKIIFILPNIYESINGVSTKYIKFINYLNNLSYNIVVFTTFSKDISDLNINNNIKLIKVKGLNIPFYKEIKIPTLSYDKIIQHINNGNEIIIFNGEFVWLYDILKKIKDKYINIKLYPTMHTDYKYYAEYSYKKYNFSNVLNHLDKYLENKLFNGIIVTGEKMKNKYLSYTSTVFNANEINLNIFNNFKIDLYDNNFYNIIYCGRISKEKNIEYIFECCDLINNKYNFLINIIGHGPFLNNLKDIIDINYKNIKDKIIFHGSMDAIEINNLYQKLDNRIFLFTSLSETFGKTPMEGGITGIPIFIQKSDITDDLYENKKNSFIFNDKKEFIELFEYFINLDIYNKKLLINNSINNIKKYDQNIIFNDWINFLINDNFNKNKVKINLFDTFTLFGLSKLINCSGMMVGD
jgi:hypothetical protein